MKRRALHAAVAALVAAAIPVRSEDGLGRNIAGFVKICVPSNDAVMASIPFHEFGTNRARRFVDVFKYQLVGGPSMGISDTVYHWVPSKGSYDTYWKVTTTTTWRLMPFGTETTNRLGPAEGFLVFNKHAYPQYLFLMGEVPSQSTAPTSTVVHSEPLSHSGYPFPSGIGMNEITLTNVSGTATGDLLRLYDILTQEYVDYFYDSAGAYGGGWQLVDSPGTATTYRFHIGDAFWLNQVTNGTGSITWQEIKPYTWP